MSPVRSVMPWRLRVQIACSMASRTSWVFMLVAVRQPTMRRE
jgi:hypothetical protein